jgi:lipid-binding SYLF domain-containing protein
MRYRSILLTALAALLVALAPALLAQSAETDEARRVRESVAILDEVMAARDNSIPQSILDKAQAIAVFPSTVKAGFIFGGMHGRGILSARREGTWTAPIFMTLTGGSFGLQIGGQATDVVLVIMNTRGVETLVRSQFKLGADASVAAGPVGRDAQASTDLQMRAEILSYSRARGLFAGLSINGSTVRADQDAIERYYGTRLDPVQVVLNKVAVTTPPPVPDWIAALTRHAPPR